MVGPIQAIWLLTNAVPDYLYTYFTNPKYWKTEIPEDLHLLDLEDQSYKNPILPIYRICVPVELDFGFFGRFPSSFIAEVCFHVQRPIPEHFF